MSQELKTEKYRVVFSHDDSGKKGFWIFGDKSCLSQIIKNIEERGRNEDPPMLSGEIKPDYVDGECALYLPTMDDFNNEEISEESKQKAIKFVVSGLKWADKNINPIIEEKIKVDPSMKMMKCFFNEKKTILQIDVTNWDRIDIDTKIRIVIPFIKVITEAAKDAKIIGDGNPSTRYIEKNNEKVKNFAIIFSNAGFGWEFMTIAKNELIGNLLKRYAKELKEYNHEEGKQKLGTEFLDKIEWFMSSEIRRWKK